MGFSTLDSLTPTLFSPAEAFAAVILAAVASDGYLATEEADAMLSSLSRMHLFQDASAESLQTMMERLHHALQQAGNVLLLKAAKDAIPQELYETAFAVAADLVLSDGVVAEEEQTFLHILYQTLGIAEDRATQILEVMMIKNRG